MCIDLPYLTTSFGVSSWVNQIGFKKKSLESWSNLMIELLQLFILKDPLQSKVAYLKFMFHIYSS